jgi:hypothetical protein
MMKDKEILASREVLEWGVQIAERLQREGKATATDVMVAWMQLCRRALRDHPQPFDRREQLQIRRLLRLMLRKAKQAGIDLGE